ncbi:U32 family peptidase [Arthrospira platensis BEA 1257B]
MWKPELLTPAKNLERLQVAITYGADAVYLGGQNYGLRARADNFSPEDLQRGVTFAHERGAKVYVTLNAFLHDEDFSEFGDYCQLLEQLNVDAVIVSDLGVMRVINNCSNLKIHLSTQASCLNGYAARLWARFGVDRLILGREVSITEAGQMRAKFSAENPQAAPLEIEMFIHGAMCMAYSGHCTISNYTAGRDSNRGGCIQSCRLPYQLSSEDSTITFMSSKDLWGIYQVGDFFKHHICSLKIEGRMKSSFYVAMTCKAYRRAIDAYSQGELTPELLQEIAADLQSIPHRDYFSGSLETAAGEGSVFEQAAGNNTGTHDYLGMVLDTTEEAIAIKLVEPLSVGDKVEFILPHGQPINYQVNSLFSVVGEEINFMRKDGIVCIPKFPELAQVHQLHLLRLSPSKVEITAPYSMVTGS